MRLITGLAAALLLVSLTVPVFAAEGPTKNITVLVDYSQSTKDARQIYAETIDTIFENVHMGDHIFVWKITGRSEMEPRALHDQEFSPKKKPVNEFYQKQAAAGMKKKEIKDAQDKMRQEVGTSAQLSGKTGILDSLHVIERAAKKYRKDKTVLVILSDMVEDSRYNFETENLTDSRISQIIAAQKQHNLVPDLSGVKIYVAGASVPKGMSTEQFNRIRNFWLRYFKESGAECPKENYGSALIGFNE